MQHVDPRLLDGLLAVGLAVGAGLQWTSEHPDSPNTLLPVVFTCLPLAVRRRYPIAAHFTQIAAAVLTQQEPVALSLVAIFISVYSVGLQPLAPGVSRVDRTWLGLSWLVSAPGLAPRLASR